MASSCAKRCIVVVAALSCRCMCQGSPQSNTSVARLRSATRKHPSGSTRRLCCGESARICCSHDRAALGNRSNSSVRGLCAAHPYCGEEAPAPVHIRLRDRTYDTLGSLELDMTQVGAPQSEAASRISACWCISAAC